MCIMYLPALFLLHPSRRTHNDLSLRQCLIDWKSRTIMIKIEEFQIQSVTSLAGKIVLLIGTTGALLVSSIAP